jgi:hypothetical protein
MIHGVARDAERIANTIAARVPAGETARSTVADSSAA